VNSKIFPQEKEIKNLDKLRKAADLKAKFFI